MVMSNNSKKIVSCLCGKVKFMIKGNLRHVLNCHCSQCMKTHGNFAAYTSTLEDNLKFISKKTLKWYRSSKKAKRGFCNKCGASIFFKFINNDTISISAGLFKNPTGLKEKMNIFVKNKLDYYKLNSTLPKNNKYS